MNGILQAWNAFPSTTAWWPPAPSAFAELPTSDAIPRPVASTGTLTEAASLLIHLVRRPVVPLDFAARHDAPVWQRAFQRLRDLGRAAADSPHAIDVAARAEVVVFVFRSLQSFARVAPAPSFSVDPDGDVWALWAAHGLDVEAHFRGPDDVFVMIEDARRRLEDFSDEDPPLQRLGDALIELGNRAFAAAYQPGGEAAAPSPDR